MNKNTLKAPSQSGGIRFKYRDLPIRYKIFILSLISLFSFIIVVLGIFLPYIYKGLLEIKRENVKDIIDLNISYLNQVHEEIRNGKISEAEGKRRALDSIRAMRYGSDGKDYLWINTYEPTMVMHPFRPDLVGQKLDSFEDRQGSKIFLQIVKICRENGGEGFLDYYWQYKDNKEKIVKKVSYVKEFKPFGWILGTGIYIEDVNEKILDLVIYIGVFFGITTILSVLATIYVSRGISYQVNNVSDSLSEIASGEGNLNVSLMVNSRDEMGKLAQYFNKFLSKIRRVIQVINMMSNELATSSTMMAPVIQKFSESSITQAESTREISSTIKEVSTGMDQIAESAKYQYEIISSLSDRMNNLSNLIHEMEKKIIDTKSLAGNISSRAKAGEESIRSMNESMARINNSSNQMKNIISIISDISKQTNLLSLNASIEAARAGDAGRGFAVVADEIAKLAVLTSQSIKNIDGLIRSNTEEITQGYSNIQGTVSMIKQIIDGITSINEMMGKLAESMAYQLEINETVNQEAERVKNKSSEIKISTEDQKTAIASISKSVIQINDITQSIASGARDMADGFEKTVQISKSLKEQVEFFKTD